MQAIRFETGRLPTETLAQVGKYAVGLLALALLYKIYQVYNARWTRPAGEYNPFRYPLEPWRKSTIEYRENYTSHTHLVEDQIVCIDGRKLEWYQIDPNPYLTKAKVNLIAKTNFGKEFQWVSFDRNGIAWVDSTENRFYRSSYNGDSKSYVLDADVMALAYDPRGVIVATKEGKIEKWIPNEQGDPQMEKDATFTFPSVNQTVSFLKRFQENNKTYIFIASGEEYELWQKNIDTWEKVAFDEGSVGWPGENVKACTIGEGKLFVARGLSISVWNIEGKNGTRDCLTTDHIITDLNYYEGRLFAVGNKLTVWDFRRKTAPGKIDQIWDKFLRLFG